MKKELLEKGKGLFTEEELQLLDLNNSDASELDAKNVISDRRASVSFSDESVIDDEDEVGIVTAIPDDESEKQTDDEFVNVPYIPNRKMGIEEENPIKSINEVKKFLEIKKLHPIKSIQEVKSIREVKSLLKIPDKIAKRFIKVKMNIDKKTSFFTILFYCNIYTET